MRSHSINIFMNQSLAIWIHIGMVLRTDLSKYVFIKNID